MAVMKPRFLLAVRHWACRVAEAVCSSVLVLSGLVALHRSGRYPISVPVWLLAAGTLLLVVAAAAHLWRPSLRHSWRNWDGFLGLRHLATCPPTWSAGALGSVLVLFSLAASSSIRSSVGLEELEGAALLWSGIRIAGLILVAALAAPSWASDLRLVLKPCTAADYSSSRGVRGCHERSACEPP